MDTTARKGVAASGDERGGPVHGAGPKSRDGASWVGESDKVPRDLIKMTTPKSVQPAQSVTAESAVDTEPPASIDAAIQGALGRKLRESYEEVVREQVPDKFLHLLNQLKKSETSGKGG